MSSLLFLLRRQNPEEAERLEDQARTVEATAFAILFSQLDSTGCQASSHKTALNCEERAKRIARRFLEAKEDRLMQEHKQFLETMKNMSKEVV